MSVLGLGDVAESALPCNREVKTDLADIGVSPPLLELNFTTSSRLSLYTQLHDFVSPSSYTRAVLVHYEASLSIRQSSFFSAQSLRHASTELVRMAKV